MRKISVPLVMSIIWFMIAWGIDTYLLRPSCELCSDLFSVKVDVAFREAAELTTKRVSLLILVLIPWIVYAFVVVPYKELRSPKAWRLAMQRWCQPLGLLIGAFFIAFAIEYFLYDPFKEHIPSAVRSYAERYSLTVSPLFPALETFKLTSHLGGLLGLIWGLYLFLSRSWSVQDR